MPELSAATLVPMAIGVLLLCLGRKIFWLFVGGVVFIVVMAVAPRFFQHQDALLFYVACAAGILAAAAGYFVQKGALRIAGFLAGGFFAFTVVEHHVPQLMGQWWIPSLIGGVVGVVIVSFLFDWALIILSSATGAFLITHSVNLEPPHTLVVFVGLSLLGIVAQARLRGKKRKNHGS